MAVKIPAAANRVFQEFRTDFLKSSQEAETFWREYAMEVPSRSRSTMHAWLANQATVREWKGPRQAKSMSGRTWEVVNRKWELTYEFERDQLDDDLEGLVVSSVMEARNSGQKFARHEDKLVADTLELGISTNCWDGQFFFDTDHPVDIDGVVSGTFDNDLALALTHANFQTAVEKMMRFKNEDGSPKVMPGGLMLMVPPELELTGKQIVEIDLLTPGAAYGLFGTAGVSKNPLIGKARLFMNPYLTDSARWYLMATGGMIKPLMLQRRRPLETSEEGEDSTLYFEEEKFRIGGSARYAASYTLPELAITSKP